MNHRILWFVALTVGATFLVFPCWAKDATKPREETPDYATRVIYWPGDEEFPAPPKAAYIPEAVLKEPALLAAALPDEEQLARHLKGLARRIQREEQPKPIGPIETSLWESAERIWHELGASAIEKTGGACDSYPTSTVTTCGINTGPPLLEDYVTRSPFQAFATVEARVPVFTSNRTYSNQGTLYYVRVDRVVRRDGGEINPGRIFAVYEPYGSLRIGRWRSCSSRPPSLTLEPGDSVFVAGAGGFFDVEEFLLQGRLFREDDGVVLPPAPSQAGDDPIKVSSLFASADEASN